jgi:hypothetical protein
MDPSHTAAASGTNTDRWAGGGGDAASASVDNKGDGGDRWQQLGGFSWKKAWDWISDSSRIHSYLFAAGLLVVISLVFFMTKKPDIIMVKTDTGVVTSSIHSGKLSLVLGGLATIFLGACVWLNGVPSL